VLPPVPPGSIRICGHFSGSVTTPSHHMDVSLPVSYTVPYVSIEPSLTAFMHASQKAKDGDNEDDHGNDGSCAGKAVQAKAGQHHKHSFAQGTVEASLWNKLKLLCHVDTQSADDKDDSFPEAASGDGAFSRQISCLSNEQAAEELEKMAHRVEQLEEHDAVLEIDYEAREALLHEIAQERDELLDERDELQRELDGLKKKIPKSPMTIRRTLTFDSTSNFLGHRVSRPSSYEVTPSRNTNSDVGSPRFQNIDFAAEHHELAAEHHATFTRDDRKVPRGHLSLEGFFRGKVRTGLHVLDVALPVDGPVLGPDLLNLGHALDKHSVMQETSRAEHGIWGKLVQVLKADIEALKEDFSEAS